MAEQEFVHQFGLTWTGIGLLYLLVCLLKNRKKTEYNFYQHPKTRCQTDKFRLHSFSSLAGPQTGVFYKSKIKLRL